MKPKYKCQLMYSAEDCCTGYMWLTEEEYRAVRRVCNTDNWEDVDDEGWSGRLCIYCEELEKEFSSQF